MMKKYILFDNDGVLVETEPWYFKANRKALGELGIDLQEKVYLEMMSDGRPCWDLARKKGIPESVISEQKQKRNRSYQEFLLNEDIRINGVEEILKELSRNFRMAIVTTSRREDFELIHRNRSIVTYMDFILTEGDYDFPKPHPAPYLKALDRYRALREEALVVEDSARGLKSAVAAGIECAVVHNPFTQTQNFSGATYRIQSLEGLKELLSI